MDWAVPYTIRSGLATRTPHARKRAWKSDDFQARRRPDIRLGALPLYFIQVLSSELLKLTARSQNYR
jgi:hypothetical protein